MNPTPTINIADSLIQEVEAKEYSLTQRRDDWYKLRDAALVKNFDYTYLLDNNCDLWFIEYLGRAQWLGYAQFISFRFTVTLCQADIDKLNAILGWNIQQADYLPKTVYSWFIPGKYDKQFGLSGIAALWRNHNLLTLVEIEAAMSHQEDNSIQV